MAQAIRLKNEIRRCMEICRECERICQEALTYCLRKGQRHAEVEHIQILLDCIDLCHTNLSIMMHGVGPHGRVCATCARMCERCAQACEQFEDEPILQSCAQVSRRCAEECRRMSEGSTPIKPSDAQERSKHLHA